MNIITIDGRILPNTDKNPNMFKYFEGTEVGDKKKTSMLSMVISSQKNYGKPDNNGYFPTNLFSVKLFGQKADFVYRNFKPGSSINIVGTLEIEPGAEKEDGTRYPNKMVIYADQVYFPAKSSGETAANDTAADNTKAVIKPVATGRKMAIGAKADPF